MLYLGVVVESSKSNLITVAVACHNGSVLEWP